MLSDREFYLIPEVKKGGKTDQETSQYTTVYISVTVQTLGHVNLSFPYLKHEV